MRSPKSIRWSILFLLTIASAGLWQVQPAAAITAQPRGMAPGIDVAVTRPVTASSETADGPAANAVDGDATTHWCPATGATNAWLTITLDSALSLNGTAVTWAQQMPSGYHIQISTDGHQWAPFPGIRSSTGSLTSFDDISGRAPSARYVQLSFSGSAPLPCVGEVRVYATTPAATHLLRGADLSMLRAEEAAGNTFSDAHGVRPAEQILADHGMNLVRLRLWVNPPNGFNNLADVSAMALRIKAAHMQFLLDIHYSDFWADPGHQDTPAAWQGQDLPTLANTVYDYTRSVIASLTQQGTEPDIVQIGNEVTDGMLWPVGELYVGNEQHWYEFTTLLKAGIAGAHDGAPQGHPPQIMIHIDRGGDQGGTQWFYDHMADWGVNYDLIGLSYYPYWHGPLSAVRYNLANAATRYGKPIMIVETAYPWTLADNDGYPNTVGPSTYLAPEYPPTPEGQALFVRDLLSVVAATPNNLGRGVVYWEPDWIPGVGWEPGAGDNWDNQTLFDPRGHALPSINAMQIAR